MLHGAYSTRNETMPVLQLLLTRRGMRGIPPDLPGMGSSSRTSAASAGESERDAYFGCFQVRTAATRERFERFVRPALGRYDAAAVERIMTGDAMDPDPDAAPFEGPAAVLVGRDDALVGWRAQRSLIDRHPRGTLAIVADAGHALLHERPELVMAVLDGGLYRVAIGSL